MSGNSVGARDPFDRAGYEREMAALCRTLDETPVVGRIRESAELDELARLVGKYPDEARRLLDRRR